MLRLLVVATAWLGACNLAQLSSAQTPSETSVREFCRGVRTGDYPAQPSPEQVVERAVCGDIRAAHLEVYADRVDRLRPNGVRAGLLMIACVENGTCKLRQAKDWYDPWCVPGRNECNFSPSRAADVAYYAHEVTSDGLRAELASSRVPPPVRAAFVAAVEDARKVIAESLGKLDPRRRAIYVSTVEQVRARRKADDEALARFAAQAATKKPDVDRAILDKRVTRPLVDEVIQLRDSYVLACLERKRTARYCLTGPVARPLARLIVRAAAALGDAPLAETEHRVLAFGPSQEDVHVEVHLAVEAAMAAENALHAEWKKLKDSGIDAGVLAERFGTTPPWNLARETNQAGFSPGGIQRYDEDIAALGEDRVDLVARPLRRVDVRGTRALLTFDGEPPPAALAKYCERAKASEPDVACAGPWSAERRGQVAPIEVPAFEASRLAPGDLVYAIADWKTRAGHIVQAFAKDGVQYRAFRGMRGSSN